VETQKAICPAARPACSSAIWKLCCDALMLLAPVGTILLANTLRSTSSRTVSVDSEPMSMPAKILSFVSVMNLSVGLHHSLSEATYNFSREPVGAYYTQIR